MNININRKKIKGFVLIIGCGRLGASLANSLSDKDMEVTIIDRNKDAFRKLSESFGGLTLVGDATDIDTLKEAQISDCGVVVCVTNNDNTNVMSAQLAKELFHVEQVISRLYDPQRECVYKEYGIETICPSVLSAQKIDGILSNAYEGVSL